MKTQNDEFFAGNSELSIEFTQKRRKMKRLFVTGVPVTGNDFAGRKEELREIRHSLLK